MSLFLSSPSFITYLFSNSLPTSIILFHLFHIISTSSISLTSPSFTLPFPFSGFSPLSPSVILSLPSSAVFPFPSYILLHSCPLLPLRPYNFSFLYQVLHSVNILPSFRLPSLPLPSFTLFRHLFHCLFLDVVLFCQFPSFFFFAVSSLAYSSSLSLSLLSLLSPSLPGPATHLNDEILRLGAFFRR